MSWRQPCRTCGLRPVAFTLAPCCFGCWPGGPVAEPPCLECGSIVGYFTNGRCVRCHRMGPARVDSCLDCYAWGATRHRGWYCIGCRAWREKRTLGTCISCGRDDLPLAPDGGCRLCRKERTRTIRAGRLRMNLPDVTQTSGDSQQLFFADMFILKGGVRVGQRGRKPPGPPPVDAVLPVGYRQERLFAWPFDLRVGRRLGFGDPPNEQIAGTLARRVDARGARYGWSEGHTSSIRGAMRVLLALQETPGAPIRASDIRALAQLGYSVPAVSAVLAEVAMFDDDREPPIVAWFAAQIAELPEPMRVELGVWFDVMRNGSSIPPRRTPRKAQTISSQLRNALPSIRHWADRHDSFREVSRDEIKAALPASGSARTLRLQSFRSIFRVLKARQLVFTNPTSRMKAPTPEHMAPAPVDLTRLRAALDDRDPPRAAVAALLAFHAIRVMDLRLLRLTDLHDGRLHVNGRTVVLADIARDCLAGYLDHRTACWPNTVNPHLFINRRSALDVRPVNTNWVRDTLGMAPNHVRRDRILDEAFATDGDLRRLTDLFGVSVSTADIFATHAHRARAAERAGT